ncbi:hypothetical protein [Peribacillus muralis]|uniref:hypothetical protein n=1 Tax=Peribacillus muralis TaxID=264697 RepID=UPI003D0563C5
MVKDGIGVSETYVADMAISGNLHKRKTLEMKTLLVNNNTISIKNDQTDSEIEWIVMDSEGEEVFSEVIKGDAKRSFESLSGKGSVKLVLNSGKQEAAISIIDDAYDFE